MSTVRITSGIYKNAKLQVPPSAHPTGERERIAIFNSLGDAIKNACVLDAFAGSGSLGLESLSRGATSADFLDNNREAKRIIVENAKGLGVWEETADFCRSGGCRREAGSASTSSRTAATAPCEDRRARVRTPDGKESEFLELYDIIFADPPYDNPQLQVVEKLINFLNPSGLLVLSLPKTLPTPTFPNLTLLSDKTYARARILIYQKN